MDQMQEVLQQHAEVITQAIWAAFPDVPLSTDVRIGRGRWMHNEHGDFEYRYGGDGLQIEEFFRGVAWRHLIGHTLQEERALHTRFFADPPPAKRWSAVIGDPLLSRIAVTWSLGFMSPRARAYYLPAYLLTALPFLAAMRFEDLPYVAGRADPIELTGHTIEALIPPLGLAVWAELAHLPSESIDPSTKVLDTGKAEDFLRFVAHLTKPQKQAIRRFVTLALMTYYKPQECAYDEMVALIECWIWPEFT